MLSDPAALVIRITRPQIFGRGDVGLGARPAEISGGVESEYRAWRDADAIVRDHAEHKRACRCADAIDCHAPSGFAERLIFIQIISDPAAAVVEYSLGGGYRCGHCRCRHGDHRGHERQARRSDETLPKAFFTRPQNPFTPITIRSLLS
jgi:hypothetical protein